MATTPQTSIAAQSTLNQMTDKLGGKYPLRVFTLDNNSKMLLVRPGISSEAVIAQLLEKYDVKREFSPYYALYISLDGVSIGRSLAMEECVTDVTSQWADGCPSKLLFMMRLCTVRRQADRHTRRLYSAIT